MTAMENTAAAVPENEAQLQELHRTMRARARRKNINAVIDICKSC